MLDKDTLLADLKQCGDRPAIVEGKKDKAALKSLGFITVVQLNSGGSLLSVVESLKDWDSVSILTDLDPAGKILHKKLLGMFNLYGIAEFKKPRQILGKMRVQQVESLAKITHYE